MTDTPLMLGDRYQVGHVLGRGGMAEVHIAHDQRLGRQVAVKMLRADLARDPSFQARFRREAQSAASLNHPAVVAVYDTGEDSVAAASVPYIVMEYVDGSTLRELLQSGRRLLPERALEITAGVLDALDYSHRRGIVHRDIKPANVMLTRSGDVKVMDFGIARALADTSSTMTQTSAVIGTAQYLSPEQARGEQVDARSDLYSTGCLLYELLTGRPPFVGDSPVAVAYQHVRENPLPPSTLDPELTPETDAIVLKALAKDRDERYQTAGEMRADIERALAGRPVDAMAAAATTRTMAAIGAPTATVTPRPILHPEDDPPPPPDRRRTGAYVLLALAVLAVFLLAAFAGTQLFGNQAERVAVPDVRGKPTAEAIRLLTAAKFQVETKPVTDAGTPGVVKSQSPPHNTRLEEGSTVEITVTVAPDTVIVPTLIGREFDDAVRALQEAGLQVGTRTERPGPETPNQVVAATPKTGDNVRKGTKVNLVVANGSNVVPDVRGLTESEARTKLQNEGFTVDPQRAETANAPAGKVFRQSPEAGSTLRIETDVTIFIATAPPTPTPTPTPTPEPTPTLTPEPTPSASVTPPPPGG